LSDRLRWLKSSESRVLGAHDDFRMLKNLRTKAHVRNSHAELAAKQSSDVR